MTHRVPATARLTVIALLVALLAGCSLFEDDGPEATPAPTATATAEPETGTQPEEPGAAPSQPNPPGTTYELSWAPADAPAAQEASEIEAPFAEFLSDDEAVWRLYVVDGDGDARLIQETGRWLSPPPRRSPTGDSVTVRYLTRIEESESFASGYERLDAATGAPRWDLLADIPSSLHLSPDGTRFAGKERSARPYNRGPLYITEPGGETLTLDGFTAERIRGWSPDGRYFITSGYAGDVTTPREQSRNYYLIEPGVDEVVLLGRPDVNESLGAVWSPDSSKVAYMLGKDLMLYDIVAHRLATVPLGVQVNDWPVWSADGRYVVVKDGVVDAEAGRVMLTPSPEPPPGQDDAVRSASVSPEGTKLAWTESIFTSDCEGLQSTRAWLKDVATEQDSVLLDCSGQVYVDVEWIDAAHLIVRSADCDQCEPRHFGLKLFDTSEGFWRDLTEGQEDGATYAVSPDRSRILVGGAKLRLYDSAGDLRRVIEVPAGDKVTSVAWSHDGFSFAYVVGPAEAFLP
jgi:WD40 repeat protein